MAAERMHDDEVMTDVPLVRRLVATQFPRWSDLPVTRVSSAGTDNALYRLGDHMVVRLPRIHWARDDVEKEHRWLPVLAPQLPVAIPTPLAMGEPAEGYPWHWSVYSWLDGRPPAPVGFPGFPSLIRELAGFITALHSIDPTGGPPATRGVPLADADEGTRSWIAAIESIESLASETDTVAITAAWEEAVEAAPWSGAPVWIHGDLARGNLLTVDDRLTAVIDFGGLGVGDPAADLMVAWNLLPAEVRRDFRAAVAVDEDTWRRGRGWALAVALGQLPYYHQTNPALADSARHVIAEVIGEHRSLG
jgi:aminoglycoside phosphotransferase (APT) family kinase protein